MGVALLLFNISRPQRLTELSNVTQMASRTLAGNSRRIELVKQTPPPAFNEKESAILVTLYEQPGSNYNAYDLAQTLNPTVRAGTPEYGTAFTKVCEATEELILRD